MISWRWLASLQFLTSTLAAHQGFMLCTILTTTFGPLSVGPLHTRAKSRDHEIVRAQKKVSKGLPKTLSKSCSVVTDPQVNCEVICDRALNHMLFQLSSIHVGPHTWDKRSNPWLWAFRVPWSPGLVFNLPPRAGFWKQSKWPWNTIYFMPCRNPCRLHTHRAFMYSVGPSSTVWSKLWTGSAFFTNESA